MRSTITADRQSDRRHEDHGAWLFVFAVLGIAAALAFTWMATYASNPSF